MLFIILPATLVLLEPTDELPFSIPLTEAHTSLIFRSICEFDESLPFDLAILEVSSDFGAICQAEYTRAFADIVLVLTLVFEVFV